jgi:hypothetical protein
MNRFDIHQLDVTTAFLHGELDEEVFIRPPKDVGMNDKVWKLKKALYGLRQAARAWNTTLTQQMQTLGFRQTHSDPCLYIRGEGVSTVYLLFHVDDAIIVGQDEEIKKVRKVVSSSVFQVKHLGRVKYFLGIEVLHSDYGFAVTQQAYCRKLLAKFQMLQAHARATPFPQGMSLVKEGTLLEIQEHDEYRSIVGGLLYLAVHTRFDISFHVGQLAKYMSCPTVLHMQAAKHLLRYLAGTADMALHFPYPKEEMSDAHVIHAYSDADLAGDKNTRKSTTGMVLLFHKYPIVWMSRLQSIVATSTAEAELIAAAMTVKEVLWLRKVLAEISQKEQQISLFCDKEATIHLIRNTTAGVSGRSKHIDLQFAFVRERFHNKLMSVEHVPTGTQLADLFTKLMSAHRAHMLGKLIGMIHHKELLALGYVQKQE